MTQKILLIILIIVTLLLTSCNNKVVTDDFPHNLALTAHITSPELVQYVDFFHLQVTGFDMEPIDVVQPYDSQSLSFELDIPAGARRTFILEAIETELLPDSIEVQKIIYRGVITADITPDGLNNISIPMIPVVPLIKLTPIQSTQDAGQSFNLGLEIFNIPNLSNLTLELDYNSNNNDIFRLDSVVNGSSLIAPDTVIYYRPEGVIEGAQNSAQSIAYINIYDPSKINPSIVDLTGYSDLASFYLWTSFSTEQFLSEFNINLLSVSLNTGDTLPVASVYIQNAIITNQILLDKVVNFPDANIDRQIRYYINDITSNPLLLSQVLPLNYFSLSEYTVTDLTGFEELKNLNTFSMTYIDVSLIDFSPLYNLSNLQNLTLTDNSLSNIQQLGQLINLQRLHLNSNQIVDISPLSTLTNISSLSLRSNRVTDLTPLMNLTKINYLNLNGNQLVDISPLSTLTNIHYLYLDDNNIIDISSLLDNPGFGSYDYIYLRNNPLDKDAISIYIPELESRGVVVTY